MKNNNREVIRRLSNRSLRKNKMRNIFIIIAITLTALLFTTLFSLGSGVMQVTQEQTMRQVGTRAHAGLKDGTMEQYEKLTSHPLVKDFSYNIMIGMATNEKLAKRQTEIRYTQEKDLEFGFVDLNEGWLPEEENEIVVDTIVMNMLGVPKKLGAEVPLSFDFMGEKIDKTFVVSGWYEGDPVIGASQVYLSKAYWEEISADYTEADFLEAAKYNSVGIGLIQGSIMFQNAYRITERMQQVIEESGYSVDEIDVGINWAYFTQMSQDLDPFSTLIIIIAFLVMMLTGYLIIYNIFQISIIGDIRFYGLLKTIGATRKQIRRIVLRQAMLLSCIGIPLGLILGFLIGNVSMPLVLTSMSGGMTTNFHMNVNPYIFLFGTLFTLITVLISCRKPSKIAGSVSPIEAIKYTETSKLHKKTKKSKNGARISHMAWANLKRNKKKTFITILSLSLSVILLTEVVTFSKSFSFDQYLESMLTGDFMLHSISLKNYGASVGLELPEDYFEEIAALNGIEQTSRMYTSLSSNSHVLSESGTQRFEQFYREGKLTVYEEPYSNIPIIESIINDNTPISEQRYAYAEELLDKLKVLEGTIDLEKFNSGNYVLISPCIDTYEAYYKPGDKITLQYQTDESTVENVVYDDAGNAIDQAWVNTRDKEYEVMAIVDIPYSMTERRFATNGLTTILPTEELLKEDKNAACFIASFWVEEDKEKAVQSFLENYTTTVNPNTDFSSKEELREELSSMSNMITIVGGSLSFIVGIVGILNFINTILTSVITRKREFAMMQSIGLTGAQLKKLLIYEGMYYIGATAVISFLIGSLLSLSVIRAFSNVVQSFEYQFTALPFIAILPIFILMGFTVPIIAYRKSMKLSVVERLREE